MKAGRVYALALLAAGWSTPARSQEAEASLRDLPLIELPVQDGGDTLAVVLTGDGGWAAGDKGIAQALVRRRISVVGFVSPSYLHVPRTPSGAGHDLERLLAHYLEAWHCGHALVIGYSRGADLVPFMVSRLPAPLRRRVSIVAMIGLSEVANFQYQPTDLFADALRANDYPILPELGKLRGLRLVCISGERERGSLCPKVDPGLARITTHPGGHRLSREAGQAVAASILGPDSLTVSRLEDPHGQIAVGAAEMVAASHRHWDDQAGGE